MCTGQAAGLPGAGSYRRTVLTGSVMISDVIGQMYWSGTAAASLAFDGPAAALLPPSPPSAVIACSNASAFAAASAAAAANATASSRALDAAAARAASRAVASPARSAAASLAASAAASCFASRSASCCASSSRYHSPCPAEVPTAWSTSSWVLSFQLPSRVPEALLSEDLLPATRTEKAVTPPGGG